MGPRGRFVPDAGATIPGMATTMPPTNDAVRERSPLLRRSFPKTPTDEEREADLANAIETAVALIESLTGRDLAQLEEGTRLWRVAMRAIVLKTETTATASTFKARKGALGRGGVRSESFGSVSFSYFGPGEAVAARALDPDRELHDLLWALCTPEKQAEWLALWGGTQPPADAVQSFAYGEARLLGNGY